MSWNTYIKLINISITLLFNLLVASYLKRSFWLFWQIQCVIIDQSPQCVIGLKTYISYLHSFLHFNQQFPFPLHQSVTFLPIKQKTSALANLKKKCWFGLMVSGFSPWLAASMAKMALWKGMERKAADSLAARKQRGKEKARDKNILL